MVAQEIEALNCPQAELSVTEGGVALRGDLRTLYALNLQLGLALKVLLRMGEFPARRFDTLVKRVAELPWETWLTADMPLLLRAQCKQSKLYHSGAVTERIAMGISERLGKPITRVQNEEDGSALTIQARLVHDVCTLSIDSSGELLHRRGYRKATGKAPLREDLARALIRASGWDGVAPLCDPMAGSGTIAIEADWLSRNVPPGHMRSFSFMASPNYDSALFMRLRQQALDQMRPLGAPIAASDRDEGAVRAMRDNAARAGSTAIQISKAPLTSAPWLLKPPERRLYVVTNPPYGKRIGEDASVGRLYHALGEKLGALPIPSVLAMAVANPEHAYATRLPLKPVLMTDHGGSKIYFSVGGYTLSAEAESYNGTHAIR
jgi:putative N6-adenine-specific DNA methylase